MSLIDGLAPAEKKIDQMISLRELATRRLLDLIPPIGRPVHSQRGGAEPDPACVERRQMDIHVDISGAEDGEVLKW
jgi:hypothetical protein